MFIKQIYLNSTQSPSQFVLSHYKLNSELVQTHNPEKKNTLMATQLKQGFSPTVGVLESRWNFLQFVHGHWCKKKIHSSV